MASRHRHESDALEPVREGEFQRIVGIGPGIEQRLHTAGVKTFDQLASLSTEEILALLNGIVGITRERVIQQDWPGQARQLAREVQESEAPHEKEQAEEPGERQHYQSFMIELLLDEDRNVKRTRVVHVQGGEKDSWVGWEPGRMASWLVEKAGLPVLEQTAPVEPVRQQLAGALALSETTVLPPGSSRQTRFFTTQEPFEIRSVIDLSGLDVPPDAALRCRSKTAARRVGYDERVMLTQMEKEVESTGLLALSVTAQGLKPGAYLLETDVLIYPAGSENPEEDGLVLRVDGGLVQVQSPELELIG